MARRRKITAASAGELLQGMWYGPEPDLEKDLGTQLNWYNACATDDDAVAWLKEYLSIVDRTEDAGKLSSLHPDWIPRTAGWLARLALRGYDLTDHNLETIDNQIVRAFHYGYRPEAQVIVPKAKPSVQDHIRDKASDLIGELEGMVDAGNVSEDSVFAFLKEQNVSAVVTKRLAEHFAPRAAELMEVFTSKDKQLQEGYKCYSPEELEQLAIVYHTLAQAAETHKETAKPARKPRKRKAIPVEKLLRHFQYAKQHDKLVSVEPSKILGKQELWTFNFKSNVLSVYRAADMDGLKIRRSMIINIDENTSVAKKIGRKTEERLQTVLEGGKVALRKLMESINGNDLSVKRITQDVILLRVL